MSEEQATDSSPAPHQASPATTTAQPLWLCAASYVGLVSPGVGRSGELGSFRPWSERATDDIYFVRRRTPQQHHHTYQPPPPTSSKLQGTHGPRRTARNAGAPNARTLGTSCCCAWAHCTVLRRTAEAQLPFPAFAWMLAPGEGGLGTAGAGALGSLGSICWALGAARHPCAVPVIRSRVGCLVTTTDRPALRAGFLCIA